MLGGTHDSVSYLGTVLSSSVLIDLGANDQAHRSLMKSVHGEVFDGLHIFVHCGKFSGTDAKHDLAHLTEAAHW